MDTRPLAKPGGKKNWVEKAGGLPPYVRALARAIARKHGGKVTSRDIATAIVAAKKNQASKHPEVAKRGAAASAQWAAMKASRHVR